MSTTKHTYTDPMICFYLCHADNIIYNEKLKQNRSISTRDLHLNNVLA